MAHRFPRRLIVRFTFVTSIKLSFSLLLPSYARLFQRFPPPLSHPEQSAANSTPLHPLGALVPCPALLPTPSVPLRVTCALITRAKLARASDYKMREKALANERYVVFIREDSTWPFFIAWQWIGGAFGSSSESRRKLCRVLSTFRQGFRISERPDVSLMFPADSSDGCTDCELIFIQIYSTFCGDTWKINFWQLNKVQVLNLPSSLTHYLARPVGWTPKHLTLGYIFGTRIEPENRRTMLENSAGIKAVKLQNWGIHR